MSSAAKLVLAYAFTGLCVLVWGLSFGNVIDRDLVPFAAVVTLVSGWASYRVSIDTHDWPQRGRATGVLFSWILVVVLAVGAMVPGNGCYTDWDGRSNPTVCP